MPQGFRRKEQGCSRRRSSTETKKFQTWDERQPTDSGRCLSGGIGQGGAEQDFPARRVSLPSYPFASLKNRGLDSLKFASTIAFVPRAAQRLGRSRRCIFLENRTRIVTESPPFISRRIAVSFSRIPLSLFGFIDSQLLDISHRKFSAFIFFLSLFFFKTFNYTRLQGLVKKHLSTVSRVILNVEHKSVIKSFITSDFREKPLKTSGKKNTFLPSLKIRRQIQCAKDFRQGLNESLKIVL